MGWIPRRPLRPPSPVPHACALPRVLYPPQSKGDQTGNLWRCDHCNTLWQIQGMWPPEADGWRLAKWVRPWPWITWWHRNVKG